MAFASVSYPNGKELATWVDMQVLNNRAQLGVGYAESELELIAESAFSILEGMGFFIRHAIVKRKLRQADFSFDTRGYPFIYRMLFPVRSIKTARFRQGTELPVVDMDAQRIYFDVSDLSLALSYGSADLAEIEIECGYLPSEKIAPELELLLGSMYAQTYHTRTYNNEMVGFTDKTSPAAVYWMDAIKVNNGGISLPLPEISVS